LGLSAEPVGPVLKIDGRYTQVARMQLESAPNLVDAIGKLRHTRVNNYSSGIIKRARLRKNLHLLSPAE